MPVPKKKPKYSFAAGSRLGNKRDAQRVGEVLDRLSRGGQLALTADVVLREAENARSPLHKFFDWNDRSAARKYRLDQARLILRSIVVYHVDNGGQTKQGHGWYSVREGKQITYVKAEKVWETPSLRERIVEQARRDMNSWISRYEGYEFLSKSIKTARRVVAAI